MFDLSTMTLECWVNLDLAGGGPETPTQYFMIDKEIDEEDRNFALYGNGTGLTITPVFNVTDSAGGGSGTAAKGTTNLVSDGFHYVVGVNSGVSPIALKLYVNGDVKSLDFAGTIPANTSSNATSFAIGRDIHDVGRYFDGQIDEVRVYNRALSAAEVKALYNETRMVRSASQTE